MSSGWIRTLRGERTQERFAELLGGTVSKAMISKWENDQDEPSAPNAVKLLRLAGLLHSDGDGGTQIGVASPAMNPIQRAIMEYVLKLPDEAQEKILLLTVREADKHSQEAAALAKKG